MLSRICALILLLSAATTMPLTAQTMGGCPVLPPNHALNTPIDTLPKDPKSDTWVNTIGASRPLHRDFGSGLMGNGYTIGIPYNVVDGNQPMVPVTFRSSESDQGPYPIPRDVVIEHGPTSTGDRHVLIVETKNCILYEMFNAAPQANGSWLASSGAIFDLKSNRLRPDGWTSADAAGLPITAGLVRYDEVMSGEIKHAIRFTTRRTRRAYEWPARHYASRLTDGQYPAMGQRFRLKKSFDTSRFSFESRVILDAMKKYGIILADNGGDWYISGAPDPRWNNGAIDAEFNRVKGSDFEAVDVSSMMVDRNSGEAAPQLGLRTVTLASHLQTTTNSTDSGNQVELTGVAPNGGAIVKLSSSHPALLQVPATVTVPAGADRSSFAVQLAKPTQSTTVMVSASYLGVTRTASMVVEPHTAQPAVALGAFNSNSNPITGGNPAAAFRVQLTGNAPAGGAVVALQSANPALLKVPATVTVPAGQAEIWFSYQPAPVAQPHQVAVTASYGGVAKIISMRLIAPVISSVQVPSEVKGSGTFIMTVALSGPAPASGTAIALSSSNTGVIQLPARVVMPAGENRMTLPVSCKTATRNTDVSITVQDTDGDRIVKLIQVKP